MLTVLSSKSYGDDVSIACDIRRIMSGLGQRIKEAREMRNISQEALGRACGVTRAAVAQWEKEDNPTAPTMDKIEPIVDLLDVDVSWLLSGRHARSSQKTTEVGVSTIAVPEYDVRVSAGGGFQIADETKKDTWQFSRRYIADELRLTAAKLVVLEVVGDSMEPTLRSGDRVLVNMADKRVSQPGLFVLWDGDGTVIKRLEIVPNIKPVRLRRISDNPMHGSYEVPAVDTTVVGRVVWFARRV